MEWSRTKTIFILAFLILDIYLGYQFFQLCGEAKYPVIENATIEEQLAAEGIQYDNGKLPADIDKGFYITAKSKDFTVEEVSSLENQTLVLSNSNIKEESYTKLNMQLNEPFPLPEVNVEVKTNQFIKDNIIGGELYHYWYTDETTNSIIYIQQYDNKNIFQSKDDHIAMVVLYVNEENEIYAYEQSMLVDINEVEEKETVISAFKAIEVLYNKNYLKTNSTIRQVQYGFYTHIPLTNQQILAPIWYIIVDTDTGEREDFYINALEGDVLQSTN